MDSAETPPPGSDAAIAAGCTCPVYDNAHGRGYMGMAGVYAYTAGCPLHGAGDDDGQPWAGPSSLRLRLFCFVGSRMSGGTTMRTAREVVDVACQQHHETEKAYLVSDSGDRDDAVWLPKSQVERGDAKGGGVYLFTMPEWLAVDKGLV